MSHKHDWQLTVNWVLYCRAPGDCHAPSRPEIERSLNTFDDLLAAAKAARTDLVWAVGQASVADLDRAIAKMESVIW